MRPLGRDCDLAPIRNSFVDGKRTMRLRLGDSLGRDSLAMGS
jgi:hypothetical protein